MSLDPSVLICQMRILIKPGLWSRNESRRLRRGVDRDTRYLESLNKYSLVLYYYTTTRRTPAAAAITMLMAGL